MTLVSSKKSSSPQLQGNTCFQISNIVLAEIVCVLNSRKSAASVASMMTHLERSNLKPLKQTLHHVNKPQIPK